MVLTQQTFLVFQNVFKTSWRRLQRNTFRLPRPLEDVLKTYLQYVFLKHLQDVLKTSCKTSSRCFQDVFKMCLQDVLQLCLQDASKMSWRRLGRQKNVTLKTSWGRLQDVFSTSSPRRMFAGEYLNLFKNHTFLKKVYQSMDKFGYIHVFHVPYSKWREYLSAYTSLWVSSSFWKQVWH